MSVELFRQILVDLSQGKLTAEQAQRALGKLVQTDAAQTDTYLNLLNQLYKKRKLPVALYSQLREGVVNPDAEPDEAVDPLAALDAADSAPEADNDAGKTQFRMPAAPASKPPETGNPDATQFRTPPPSRTGATSQPPSQTGQSVARTGSNWSSPSAWTGIEGQGGQPGAPIGEGSVIKDRFVLEKIIGRGGMGMVFKARDLRKEEAQDRNPYVALKILNEEFKRHPESLKALQRESRKAQSLAHPNIVNVHDFDRDGGTVFMTMELLEGKPLDVLIRENRGTGMPWKEALPLIQGMCLALQHAHKSNIIHSDFKPGNCFLTNDGAVKVFDFGIARAAKHTGEHKGEETLFDAGDLGALTPAYATIEMSDGKEPDQRDDVYALGCTIYELLSGQHPFNKESAARAQEQDLTPKPIKGLSRSRFNALCKSLSLKRSKRTRSAFQLLEDLNPRNEKKYFAVGFGVLAVVMVAIAALVLVPNWLYRKKLESITALLQTKEYAEVETAVARFDELEDGDVSILLGEYGDQIIGAYDSEIAKAFNRDDGRYDYPRARAILDELMELYNDSSRVEKIGEQIEVDRNEVQAKLSAEYEALIAAGKLLPSSDEDVFDVLETARELDPDDELLTDIRLPQALAAEARTAAGEQDFDLAREILDVGFDVAPDDLTLINVRDEVEAASAALERARRIASLEQTLRPLLSTDATLATFGDEIASLQDLAGLEPDNTLVVQTRSRIEDLLAAEVSGDIAKRDWSVATARLDEFAQVLDSGFVTTQSGLIDSGRRGFEQMIEALTARVDQAIADGNLETPRASSALALFAQLEDAGADSATLAAAKDRIASGYLDASRAARFKQDWETARVLAAKVEGLAPSASIVADAATEIGKIDNQETLAVQEVQAQEIESLQQRVNDRIALASIGKSDIDAAVRVLTDLVTRFGDDAGVQSFDRDARGRLAQRIATQARVLGDAERWQDAVGLLEAGTQALGTVAVLSDTTNELAQQQRERASAAANARVSAMEQDLAALLANAGLDAAWQNELDQKLTALEKLQPGNPYATEARERAASLYLSDAATLSGDSRWSAAEQQIKRAQSLAPTLAAVVAQTRLFEEGRRAFELEQTNARKTAEIDGKRDRFTRELVASRVDQAEALFRDLKTLMDASDPFIATDGPAALVSGYLKVANENASKDRYSAALQQLTLAQAYAPGDARLSQAEARFQGQRAAYNAVSTGSASEVRALSGLLSSLEPVVADFTNFKSRLERIIKRRIEDRALSNRSDARALLTAARDPFPALDVQIASAPTAAAATPPPVAEPVREPEPPRPVVQAPVQPRPQVPVGQRAAGKVCSTSIAGNGRSKNCRDGLTGNAKGPILVVVPGVSGGPDFAISRSEISVKDFNVFCQQSGQCSPLPGETNMPATGIDSGKMQSYAEWLSSITGKQYAIPSLEQWRHAARAGTGDLNPNINCRVRIGGKLARGLVMGPVSLGGTAQANAWGLRQVAGNAQELVQNGASFLLAGGAYTDRLDDCTTSFSRPYSGPSDVTGFRLVRNVDGT
ncbi:MAG: protein kinase [Gammaproteobacteria bacterium]